MLAYSKRKHTLHASRLRRGGLRASQKDCAEGGQTMRSAALGAGMESAAATSSAAVLRALASSCILLISFI